MKTSSYLSIVIIVASFFLAAVPTYGEEPVFPGDGFVEGWKISGKIREFSRSGLYGHINGGSELFLEFGFHVLHVRKYQGSNENEEDEISIETYKMESPEAALGIYLMKSGSAPPVPGIDKTVKQVRSNGDSRQIMLLKGNYFVIINNFSGKSSLMSVMVRLANQTLEKIPSAKPLDLLTLLPEENRVPGSEMLFRGPYSLEAIYTLGNGDVLQLDNKIFGVTAQYVYNKTTTRPKAEPETYNQLLVCYPSKISSQKAFSYLKANLDSYILVLKKSNDRLTFKDYRGKFGEIFLKGDIIHIKVNLPDL